MTEVSVEQDDDVIVLRDGDVSSIVVILEEETEIIQTLEQGPPGPMGPVGPQGGQGEAGNSILYGDVDPTIAIGSPGDYYINNTNEFLFGPKADDWPAGTALVGPVGPQGPQGNTGPIGPQGIQGPQGVQGPQGIIAEAPLDGKIYGRSMSTWVKSGGGSTVSVGDVPPTGVDPNSMWWESDTGLLYIYFDDGSGLQWVQTGAQASGAAIAIGDLPPAGPLNGMLWWESDTGILWMYYADANSSQWVAVGGAAGVGSFVAKTGDTMTGDLKINKSNPVLRLDKLLDDRASEVKGQRGGLDRWTVQLGSNTVEGGSNTGSDFIIFNHADNGTAFSTQPLTINRATSLVTLIGALAANGGVTINKQGPVYVCNRTTGDGGGITGQRGGVNRWIVEIGGGEAESGSNVGSNYNVHRCADDGTVIERAFSIARDSGFATFNRSVNVTDSLNVTGARPLLSLLGPTAELKAWVNGLERWTIQLNDGTAGQDFGIYRHHDDGSPWDRPIVINRADGHIDFYGKMFPQNNVQCRNGVAQQPSLSVWAGGGWPAFGLYMQGETMFRFAQVDANGTPVVNLGGWNNLGHFQVDSAVAYKAGGGTWNDSSDARIKNVLGDFTEGLTAITSLRPVKYTFKGNDTQYPPEARKTVDAENRAVEPKTKDAPTVPYGNSPHYNEAVSGKEFVGLIAQEAEAVFPQLVSQRAAMIDGQPVTDMRDIDTGPLVFALINATKEMAARIASLEAQVAALTGVR